MAVQHFFNAGRLFVFISENFFSFYFVFSIISFNFAA
jgi:hypothetical protein